MNENSKAKASFDEFNNLFYTSVYGLNNKCQTEIERVFYDFKTQRKPPIYLFFEYFLASPLPVNADAKLTENNYLIAPFAPRLVENNITIPILKDDEYLKNKFEAIKSSNYNTKNLEEDINDMINIDFRDDVNFKGMKLAFKWEHSLNIKYAYNYWADKIENKERKFQSEEDGHVNHWHGGNSFSTNEKFPFGCITKWTPLWQILEYVHQNIKTADFITSKSALLQAGFMKVLFPDDVITKKIPGILIPIASSNLFYGAIWIMLPSFADSENENDNIIDSIGHSISKLIHDQYVASLAMLHEHWYESQVKKNKISGVSLLDSIEIKLDGSKLDYYCPFLHLDRKYRITNNHNSFSCNANEIEYSFSDLWHNRKELTFDKFKEDLIFKSYLIVSQKMLECFQEVIVSTKTMSKRNDTLPACLVIGGAGSGKDKLAKIIKLFSKNYKEGNLYTINLASIRPSPLTATAIVGAEIELTPKNNIELKGVLTKMFINIKDNFDNCPTIIFDEFNSMDIDSQGILLRFLDNSEILPMGALNPLKFDDDKKINCLVIGIMNEDPEDISREKAIDFFKNNPYLGGFISDTLYEHFMKIRRLRPDIKYRMIRNGKFVIPPLKDRPEDITILFYVFIKEEISGIAENYFENIKSLEINIHLTLQVLNRLISKDLLWQGNIRQLQALAKVVSRNIWSSQITLPKDKNEIICNFNVCLSDLEEALKVVSLI